MLAVDHPKQWRRYFAVALASIHLTVISFFSFAVHLGDSDKFPQSQNGIVKILVETVTFYASWSGTATAYNYFAPNVALVPRTRFRILYVSGEVSDHILGVDQFEVDLRVATLARTALKAPPHIIARSLAAMVFDQEREAERVTVIFENLSFPDFHEAIEGQQVSWAPAYSADFVKNGNELTCLC